MSRLSQILFQGAEGRTAALAKIGTLSSLWDIVLTQNKYIEIVPMKE